MVNENDRKKIIKLIFLIAVVLSILSLVFPWGEMASSESSYSQIFVYSWGVIDLSYHSEDLFHFFILAFSPMNDDLGEDTNLFYLYWFVISLMFLLLVAGIILSIYLFKKFEIIKNYIIFITSILLGSSFLIFYVIFGLIRIPGELSYSLGYYFIIFSAILHFSVFYYKREFMVEKTNSEKISEINKQEIKLQCPKCEMIFFVKKSEKVICPLCGFNGKVKKKKQL